ncbi:MAG: hypothetical protein ACAH17_00830 [Candidatus Paceibacterota bacterium]
MKVQYYRYPVFGALLGWSVMLLVIIVSAMLDRHVSTQKVLVLTVFYVGILLFLVKLGLWAFAYELGRQDAMEMRAAVTREAFGLKREMPDIPIWRPLQSQQEFSAFLKKVPNPLPQDGSAVFGEIFSFHRFWCPVFTLMHQEGRQDLADAYRERLLA